MDVKHRIAQVEPAEDAPGRSTWLGSSQALSYEICEAMREVLLGAQATLSRRATEQMDLLAAQGTVDPGGTVLRATKTGCEWWTWAGLKANATLVQRFGLPATADSMTIRARCTPIELKRLLEAPPREEPPDIPSRFRPKFEECLPDNLLVRFAQARLYDWPAATRLLENRIVYSDRTP